MLEKINSPQDLKSLSLKETEALAGEIRQEIITATSHNGGHLASNLGMVEASIVLHKVFNAPEDKIIFDVGHQCYAHKLLTGRKGEFSSLRSFGGISGFTSPKESAYDEFYAGHCGPSISLALGEAAAAKLRGSSSYTVAVVGDGAFTNGMIYEALNNLTDTTLKLIIVLNDNEMSISRNVGTFSSSLSHFRTSQPYFSFKRRLKRNLLKIPLIGKNLNNFAACSRDLVRRMLVKDNVFEVLGIEYLGPVDGNDIAKLEAVVKEAKSKNKICVVHMTTKKGLGYAPALAHPEKYHSVGAFDPLVGYEAVKKESFSSVFGQIICEQAQKNDKICAITAAMCEGTGLGEYSLRYPERFFDVGIAEEHAVAFTSGLSKAGMQPVCAIYSTFMQRCYDQVFHDIALQDVGAVFALDRSGFVEGDGVTHQGLYDVGLFSSVPGSIIYSPETFDEMRACFEKVLNEKTLSFVRYPKGGEIEYDRDGFVSHDTYSVCNIGKGDKTIVFYTYSRVCANVYAAAEVLGENYRVRIVKFIKIFPLDNSVLENTAKDADLVVFVEEGQYSGGIAEKTAAVLMNMGIAKRFLAITAKEGFIPQGKLNELYDYCGLSGEKIVEKVNGALEK